MGLACFCEGFGGLLAVYRCVLLFWLYSIPFAVDRPHMKVGDILGLTWSMMNRNWCTFFGVILYSIVVAIGGFLCFIVGLIPAISILVISNGLLYARAFGLYDASACHQQRVS